MWQPNHRAPRGVTSKGQGQGKRGRAPPPPPTPPPGGYRILVLVGIPGSGKSTFSSFLEDLGWTTVSQDALGSREKCRRRAQEVLQRGGRVVIDRCNFDQSQRVTWIDMAVSLSLHKDACIAVWLDVDIGVCQERVRSRVGHRTLGPGPASAGIIKRVAGDLRPPHRKEGFHAVLRCKGGDQQSLSDAVALLSGVQGGGCDHGDVSVPLPEVARASSAPASGGSRAGGGGVGSGWGGVESAGMAWGQPAGAGGRVLSTDHGWESFPADGGSGSGSGMGMSGAAGGCGFPAGGAYSSDAAVGVSMPQGQEEGGSALAWGAGHQQVGVEGFDGSAVGMGGVAKDARPAGTHNADFYPPLPGGNNGSKARRFNGRIGKGSPQPRGYRSSSLSSIARLTPQRQSEASAAPKQPQKPKARLLTPAEITAKFSDLQVPPRVMAPQDVALTAPVPKPGPKRRTKQADRHDPRAESVPLAPSSLQEWTSRAAASSQDGGDSRGSQEPAALTTAALVDDEVNGGGGGRGGGSAAAAGEDKEGLGLSDGETFFVLEDMFGGLLLPESLEKVFRESGNNLEKAVREGIRLLEATAAEMFDDAPSSSTGTGSTADLSSSEKLSEAQDESDGEFSDVSEWTHKQVETLTDLCLAFEGTYTREDMIAALTASHHDATSAAQLLLDTPPSDQKPAAGPGHKTSRRHQRSGTAARRERKTRAAHNSYTGATAASLLGATCGGERRAGGNGNGDGDGWASGDEGEGREEEEEGDEGLSSEEYRALANEAAEQMKTWFQKAAEAYTRGGRNGGAAAADPSQNGQRWKKKMEAANLRAAREAFRERNPLVRVGYTNDDVSVLKVLALPRSSQCSTPGQLSIDLHLLRRAEALLVLEAVLCALARGNARFHRLPHRQDRSKDVSGGHRHVVPETNQDCSESFTAAEGEAATVHGVQSGRNLYAERFTSLEVVVGRGAHSVAGIPRLRPCVAGYLAGKRLRAEAVEGDRGKGVVVVRLDNL